ncbi:hypothetical protein [Vibrio parahaemolyticus]|uniref:hypothetical protein n=1 Tax=Vibrio parahaemolyticus TaxID=670 RepID=UPI00235F443D|nr:hypothetical protein [Vibrio parahaemolyticus]MDF4441352.1 hypothetical protein [Vibrio parahaemolyticus]HCG7925592.1 hypothetical protein [Vibrio parahaemolyticus]HCH0781502.1 hypothetical protein [Vibrio parahaemolyticus]
MYSETFKASVQYGDWKGTCAADDADTVGASTWLKDNNHMSDDEFLIGVKMFAGENHGEHRDPVSVSFMILPLESGQTVEQKISTSDGPVEVKVVRVDMDIQEFFALFKRFEVALPRSKAFDGCEYTEI